MRKSSFTTGADLPVGLEGILPMFEQKMFEGSEKPKVEKYSHPEEKRIEIFDFAIREKIGPGRSKKCTRLIRWYVRSAKEK